MFDKYPPHYFAAPVNTSQGGALSGPREEGHAGFSEAEPGGDTDTHYLDLVLEPALDALDRAHLYWHLSTQVQGHIERQHFLRQAQSCLRDAIEELQLVDVTCRTTETWQVWYAQAQADRDRLEEELQKLQEHPL